VGLGVDRQRIEALAVVTNPKSNRFLILIEGYKNRRGTCVTGGVANRLFC
jgi:hypothetical protein